MRFVVSTLEDRPAEPVLRQSAPDAVASSNVR